MQFWHSNIQLWNSIMEFWNSNIQLWYSNMQFWHSYISLCSFEIQIFIMKFWHSYISLCSFEIQIFIMQFWIKVQSRFWNMRIWLPLELVTELWYSDIQLRHSKLNSIFGFSFSILKWTYSFGRTLRDPFSKSNRVGLGITHQHNNLFPAKIVI